MKILVFSPHLDDAVLSLGALLSERSVVDDIVVATVFSAVEPAATSRLREDIAALTALGCRHRHLGLADAPVRGVPLTTAALCSGAPDVDVVAAVRAAGSAVMAAEDAAEVWLPLAVGQHIDHTAVLRALWPSLRSRAVFYEDRPYARQRGAVAAAWAALGAEASAEVSAKDPTRGSDVDDGVFFLDAVGAVAPVDRPAPAGVVVGGHRWLRHAHPVSAVGRERRQRAIACYVSEYSRLVGPEHAGGWPFTDGHEFTWRSRV